MLAKRIVPVKERSDSHNIHALERIAHGRSLTLYANASLRVAEGPRARQRMREGESAVARLVED